MRVLDRRGGTTDETGWPHPAPVVGNLGNYAIVGAVIVLFAVLSIASNSFLSWSNLVNVLVANADVGIVAVAGTMVVAAGCLDVSVGATYACCAVVAARVTVTTGSAAAGVGAGLGCGAVLGAVNGMIVTVGRVNSLVATLASALLIQSGAQVLAGGGLVTPAQVSYTLLGRGAFLGLRSVVWLLIVFVVVTGMLLSHTAFGRRVRATGANVEAARLSGVPVARVRCTAFIVSGLAAAVAGVLISSRSGQADPNSGGIPYLLQVIAAIAVGGTSLRGEGAAIWRTVLGVLFLGLVANGLNLLGVSPVYHPFYVGLLILIAVALRPSSHLRDTDI